MKFSGRNFQAWEKFDLDVQGLTVITGPSDKGKSALFRALKGLFYNKLSESYIRDGQESLELTVEIDGHTITAKRKRESSSKYTVDGKEFVKLAGGRPETLKALGVNEIRIGDTELDPIFASQNEEQFLIQGVSPAELNNILGGFASTEKLEQGKREANLRITQKNSEARTLAVEIHDAEVRKAKFEEKSISLIPILEDVTLMEEIVKKLEERADITEIALVHLLNVRLYQTILNRIVVPDIIPLVTMFQRAKTAYTALCAYDAQTRHVYHQMKIEETVAAWREVKKIYLGVLAAREIIVAQKIKNQAAELSKINLKDETLIVKILDGIKIARECRSRLAAVAELKNFEMDLTNKIEELLNSEKCLHETFSKEVMICPKCGERFVR
jgi:energy-coupling factor transporter ATP-binding protein EcfA2